MLLLLNLLGPRRLLLGPRPLCGLGPLLLLSWLLCGLGLAQRLLFLLLLGFARLRVFWRGLLARLFRVWLSIFRLPALLPFGLALFFPRLVLL